MVQMNPENDTEKMYRAQSPDEEALVKAAARNGVRLLGNTSTGVNVAIEFDGIEKIVHYEKLITLEFTGDRRRMSVVVRNPEGKYVLYIKGIFIFSKNYPI